MPQLPGKVAWAALAAISCVLLLGALFIGEPHQKVVFLDVGQGDAILLHNRTQQLLVDGGQGMAVLRALSEEMPWFDRTIEVIISTHPDRDHLEGLLHVLERYHVKLVLLPAVPHSSQLYEEWLARLTQAAPEGTLLRFAEPGQTIQAGELTIDILGPNAEMLSRRPGIKTNNASVITRVNLHDLSFLLTGDAEASVERQLVQTYGQSGILDVDVLKAGHHGSKTSTSAELVAAAAPAAAVISVGEKNRFGHPHPDVLLRLAGAQLFRTDQHGSVRFVREQGTWLLKTAK